MHSLIVTTVLICLALVNAKPSGIILKGPSGIVTGEGPIGPSGEVPHGGWDEGGWEDDHGWSAGVITHHKTFIIHPVPIETHEIVAAPVLTHGWGGAEGGWGGWGGHGDGYVALGHHGVTVKGPETVPAVIAGPAGKIVAHGLYGVSHHW